MTAPSYLCCPRPYFERLWAAPVWPRPLRHTHRRAWLGPTTRSARACVPGAARRKNPGELSGIRRGAPWNGGAPRRTGVFPCC